MTSMALAFTDHVNTFSPLKKDKVRIGIIGAGFRYHEHMGNFLQREDVEITAIADPQQRSIDDALKVFKKYGRPEPRSVQKWGYGLYKFTQTFRRRRSCRK